jgi:hypothetical protein
LSGIQGGDDQICPQIHYADFVRGFCREFLQFGYCDFASRYAIVPQRRAIRKHFKQVVGVIHG